MTSANHQPPGFDYVREETRQLVFMWGFCCCSPVIYLSLAWMAQRWLGFTGFFDLATETWRNLLIGVGVIAVVLQVLHLVVRLRVREKLEQRMADPQGFMALLTRRTFGLIFLSELPVFLGFVLWILQGSLSPIFGFGIASMFLYAQSHPRSANPAFEQLG